MNDEETPATVPGGLLTELRRFHTRRPELLDDDLPGLGLARIRTSSPNPAFALQGQGEGVCLTLFAATPELSDVDVRARQHIQAHLPGLAPRLLWHDPHNDIPAIVTTNLKSTPITEVSPQRVWRAALATVTALRRLPLGPFADRPRAGSATDRATNPHLHDLLRTTRSTRSATAHIPAGVAELLARWNHEPDIVILTQPAPRVLSPGMPDLTRWTWNQRARTAVPVEWTAVGYSDVAWDAADLVEHPRTRLFSSTDTRRDLRALGVRTAEERVRFHAAQRLLSLNWLITFHSSQAPAKDVAEQYRRTKMLLARARVQEPSW